MAQYSSQEEQVKEELQLPEGEDKNQKKRDVKSSEKEDERYEKAT